MFSAVFGAFDAKNVGWVPEGYEPLPFNPETDVEFKMQSAVLSSSTPFCSHRIKWKPIETQSAECAILFIAGSAIDKILGIGHINSRRQQTILNTYWSHLRQWMRRC